MTWLEPVDPEAEQEVVRPSVIKLDGTWVAMCMGHSLVWEFSGAQWADPWTAALMQAIQHFVTHHRPVEWHAPGRPGEESPT